jgi:hypothetical protein
LDRHCAGRLVRRPLVAEVAGPAFRKTG